ncbi:MAG: hypothetical protein JKX81_05455 [Arenicella sp.]|nr:hypothetical protein [Arenicella sp.]
MIKKLKLDSAKKNKRILRQALVFFSIMVGIWITDSSSNAETEVQIDYEFTPADIAFLSTFSLDALPPLPVSAGNKYADSVDAAKLGQQLFFDKRLSHNRKISCASCHQPHLFFTDGRAKAKALGISQRSTPTLLGAAWSPWQYWDGRKDSLWAQALGPIEHPDEMGISRTALAKKIIKYYPDQYQAIFGNLDNTKPIRRASKKATPLGNKRSIKEWNKLIPDTQDQITRIFANTGKALMAYQRMLKTPHSRFDSFIHALQQGDEVQYRQQFSVDEVRGMRLFMGKANCASCHNGPLFTNFEFHNIGAPEADESNVDLGRYSGVTNLIQDEFTCLSKWSDADQSQCEEMTFLKRSGPELVGAFKTPTLRNISVTSPYMQSGQFPTLRKVIEHYNRPVPPYYDREQHPNRPHFDILPLKLSEEEIQQLLAFLNTLTSEYPEQDIWWRSSIKERRH